VLLVESVVVWPAERSNSLCHRHYHEEDSDQTVRTHLGVLVPEEAGGRDAATL